MNAARSMILLSLMLPPALVAQGAEITGPLRGEYSLHGESRVDPPPGEPQDSRFGLVLTGAAARDLYRRMKVKSERDLCLDDGSRIKTQGPVRCMELAGKGGWRCEFAIRLDTMALVADGTC
jgi:hypothetical protein